MRIAALVLALLAVGCQPAGDRVDPAEHDAFFLWPGVTPPAGLARARTVYVLVGEVRRDDPARLVPLRPQPPRGVRAELWLTVRAERLDWGDGIYAAIERTLRQWRGAGNRVSGVQIDFDAATKGLASYASFLAEMRRRLPPGTGLSVTGLMDWGANADPAALQSLVGVVDEVVVQTYQGRATIPGYERYFERLARLPVPHRVALVEGGEWTPPPALKRDPQFKGYVVFLLAPRRP